MHLTLDYDYLRSETDFTEMEGLEEMEGMEEMEGRKEWLRTGSVPSPLRDAMMSSSPNHLPSSVIFLVLVAAVTSNANLMTFVINITDICQFWDTTALFSPVKVHQKVRNFAK